MGRRRRSRARSRAPSGEQYFSGAGRKTSRGPKVDGYVHRYRLSWTQPANFDSRDPVTLYTFYALSLSCGSSRYLQPYRPTRRDRDRGEFSAIVTYAFITWRGAVPPGAFPISRSSV